MASVPMPGYPQVRLCATPKVSLEITLADFAPDVVHLASPINVGYRAALAAAELGLPTVAVYQTDVPGYARRYGVPALEAWLWQRVRRTHRASTLTLAPSTASLEQLRALGVGNLHRWGRGVDAELFHPGRRDPSWRAGVAPAGHRLVGFVGRLAPEKQVEDLRVLADLPDTTLVVIGDGPERERLGRVLPSAVFLGVLRGAELARAVAGLDVFVTPGELAPFGQPLQEAMAAGVPVGAPAAGGPVDLVDPSRTGWLYPPGDLEALRDRVRDLLGDDAKRRAFGRAARASMEPRSSDAVCRDLVRHYRRAIDAKRSSLVAS